MEVQVTVFEFVGNSLRGALTWDRLLYIEDVCSRLDVAIELRHHLHVAVEPGAGAPAAVNGPATIQGILGREHLRVLAAWVVVLHAGG